MWSCAEPPFFERAVEQKGDAFEMAARQRHRRSPRIDPMSRQHVCGNRRSRSEPVFDSPRKRRRVLVVCKDGNAYGTFMRREPERLLHLEPLDDEFAIGR